MHMLHIITGISEYQSVNVMRQACIYINTFVTIYSNRIDGSARPIRDVFPYYAISAAYNSPIMHNGRLAQGRT